VVTGAAGWPRILRSLPIAAALKAVSPKAVGDRAIKLSDRGERGGSACLGAHFAFQTIVLKLERLFESRQDGGLENREL
jgi:hypothetical protein